MTRLTLAILIVLLLDGFASARGIGASQGHRMNIGASQQGTSTTDRDRKRRLIRMYYEQSRRQNP